MAWKLSILTVFEGRCASSCSSRGGPVTGPTRPAPPGPRRARRAANSYRLTPQEKDRVNPRFNPIFFSRLSADSASRGGRARRRSAILPATAAHAEGFPTEDAAHAEGFPTEDALRHAMTQSTSGRGNCPIMGQLLGFERDLLKRSGFCPASGLRPVWKYPWGDFSEAMRGCRAVLPGRVPPPPRRGTALSVPGCCCHRTVRARN